MVSMVVAVAENGVIGETNSIPWYLPADLAHFKEKTLGHTVLMGRKTYQSIMERLGHPLTDRRNVVITTQEKFQAPGCEVFSSLETALASLKDEDVYVIGGAEVYQQALPLTDRIFLTKVHATPQGDKYFPELKTTSWKEVDSELHHPDEKNPVAYTFMTYERIK
jgi:dihydrofolate reductase